MGVVVDGIDHRMVVVAPHLLGEVTTERDVHHLEATADPEDRFGRRERRGEKSEVGSVGGRLDGHARLVHRAVAGRIHVLTTHENHTVDEIDHRGGFGVVDRVGGHDRQSAGSPDRVDVLHGEGDQVLVFVDRGGQFLAPTRQQDPGRGGVHDSEEWVFIAPRRAIRSASK